MTTPEKVAEILADDKRLSKQKRDALAELFRVAYEQLTKRKKRSRTADKLSVPDIG